jgi:phosphoadenosine phosphosulfate reductase
VTYFSDGRSHDDEPIVPADRPVLETSGSFLSSAFPRLEPVERLVSLSCNISGPIVFTTSFGLEDQALTHLISVAGIECRFATLDTGRLFPETYAVWAATEQRYGIRVRAFYPAADALEALVAKDGINGFYQSTEARHSCCGVRKVEPLRRALLGAEAWLTGVRADQSANRQSLDFARFDEQHGLLKVNPLLDWSRERVAALVRDQNIPYNALHDEGFLSIGCAPCTRAVAPGKPERAGRWWWEQDETRECGLHLTADGRLVRTSS